MTKSAKAKKARKADFAKVKLKVGKKLKKAQNETRVDFKARKIIMREQLAKKEGDNLLTKKKHNVKELVSRLSHSNTFVRQDGINGLTELVRCHPLEALLPQLPVILPATAPTFFDGDALIRNTAIKFVESLIVKLGGHIEPYFRVIATHLSCAMVNLSVGVQSDSVRLMHVLVTHCPALTARHAHLLLTNFVHLISRKTNSSQQGAGRAQAAAPKASKVDFSQLLHRGPADQLTSQQSSRLSLLQELGRFLEVVVREQGQPSDCPPHTPWQTVLRGSLAPVWVPGDQGGRGIVEEQLEGLLVALVPVLFQVWAEVDPRRSSSTPGEQLLSEADLDLVTCLVHIFTSLWTLSPPASLKDRDSGPWHMLRDRYLSSVLPCFPFFCHTTQAPYRRKKKSGRDAQGLLKHCDALNIYVALLAVRMCAARWVQDKMVNFLTKLLRDGTRDSHYQVGPVVEVVVALLPGVGQEVVETMVGAAWQCYARLATRSRPRAPLLQLLLLATDIDHSYMWQSSSVEAWVTQLVEELATQDVSENLLTTANCLRLRDNSNMRSLLHKHNHRITENVLEKGVQGLTKEAVHHKLNILLRQ